MTNMSGYDFWKGQVFVRRLRAMGIRNRPISPSSPWQNGYVERLIGSVRRECLDHMLIFGEAHLKRILARYAAYYNQVRTHLALDTRSSKSAVWKHCCDTRIKRPTSSLWPDMIFGRDKHPGVEIETRDVPRLIWRGDVFRDCTNGQYYSGIVRI